MSEAELHRRLHGHSVTDAERDEIKRGVQSCDNGSYTVIDRHAPQACLWPA
jgi:hypothetical protein